jgi:hypothetical protein
MQISASLLRAWERLNAGLARKRDASLRPAPAPRPAVPSALVHENGTRPDQQSTPLVSLSFRPVATPCRLCTLFSARPGPRSSRLGKLVLVLLYPMLMYSISVIACLKHSSLFKVEA